MYTALIAIPPLLLAVILHEIAHAYAAERLGDPTARRLGRITLNPIKHIDPYMTLLIPGLLIAMGSPFIFGGAKPVPVNPMQFKNPRRDMAYVALAGPVTNFVLAILCYLSLEAFSLFYGFLPLPKVISVLIGGWLGYGIIINLILGVFNLLPVPPLDGGRIVVGFLPIGMARAWAKLEPFGLLIVVALIYCGILEIIFEPVLRLVQHFLSA